MQYIMQCSWWWTSNSFETCRARKNCGIKIIYKNCASRWSSTHCNMMHGTYNVKLHKQKFPHLFCVGKSVVYNFQERMKFFSVWKRNVEINFLKYKERSEKLRVVLIEELRNFRTSRSLMKCRSIGGFLLRGFFALDSLNLTPEDGIAVGCSYM